MPRNGPKPDMPLTISPWRKQGRELIVLALPLIGANLAQIGIGTTDTIMLGWLGIEELAAGVMATQALFVFIILGTGFALAVMPIVAQALGSGDERRVRRASRMGLWVVTIFSALAMFPLWYTEAILLALGQEPETAAVAQTYMRIAQWGLFPVLYLQVLRSFFSGLERTGVVLLATVVGLIINALLDYMLIFGKWGAPALGVEGAALASVGSTLVATLVLTAYALMDPVLKKYQLFVRIWRADWPDFFEVFKVGAPIGITLIAEVGLFVASSVMMGWLGTVALAAHGIALQIASIAFMVPLGLANAATVRVGITLGRNDHQALKISGWLSYGWSLAFAGLAALVFITFDAPLISMFLDKNNDDVAQVLQTAIPLLWVAAAFQLGDCAQVVGSGLLRGFKDATIPMIISVVSYWLIGMTTAYVLGFVLNWQGVGIWTGLAFGLGLAAVLIAWRYQRRINQLKQSD